MDFNADSNSPPGPSPAAAASENSPNRLQRSPPPALQRLLVSLRIWIPYLMNPHHRAMLARYSALDERVGLLWKVSLPQQCWQCGKAANLKVTEHRLTLRAFENPIALLAGSAAGVGIGLLLLLFMPGIYTFLLLLAIAAIGLGVLWLKSWTEEVRLTMFTCSEHAGQAPCPDMAIDDQHLCVFLATREMAEAAREQIQAKRKTQRPAYDTSGSSTPSGDAGRSSSPRYVSEPPMSKHAPAPLPPASVPLSPDPRRIEAPPAELPPIKLAGEEDEPVSP